jgi:hypothetical protein
MTHPAQRLIKAIELAFAGVRLEDGISLREAIVLDNDGTDEDRHRARSQDELEDWRKIPEETIGLHSASLAFLDAKGMRFYLPAFMRFALRHFRRIDLPSIDCTLFALDYTPGSSAEDVDIVFAGLSEEQRKTLKKALDMEDPRQAVNERLHSLDRFRLERFSLLTDAQREAVRRFLQFMVFETVGQANCRVAWRALERGWKKPQDGSQPGAHRFGSS